MAIYRSSTTGEIRVPVMQWLGDPEDRRLQKILRYYGLGSFVLMDMSGQISETEHVIEPVHETRYTRALDEIRAEENAEWLDEGTTSNVLQMILRGEFDTSAWADWYGLPDQPAESQNSAPLSDK